MTDCPDPHNDRLIQMQIQRCHSQIYHNNSIRSTKHINTTNFHYKLRRIYSTILVKYHYMVILVGILFAGLLTGLSFLKQPLPDIMDPSRGFGARGPGTLTSQLIVMKNVNSQLTKYNDYILDLYEKKKLQNISAEPKYDQNFDQNYYQNFDPKYDQNYDQNFNPKYDQNYDQNFDHNYDQNVDHYDYDNGTIYDLENAEKEPSINKRQIVYELSDEDELELLLEEVIYNNLKGDEIIGMLEPGKLKMTKYPSVSQTYATCNFSSALDSNLEFYFHNKDNHDMLSVDNLKKLCQWDQSLSQSLNFSSNCYISLPRFIQLLNNKSKCEDIDESDVAHLRNVTKACHRLENSGVLYAFAEADRHKSDILKLIDKKKPLNKFVKLAGLDQSICSYKNLMYIFYEFLVDKNFASTDRVSYSALVISNENKVYSNEFLFNYYYRNYHGSSYKLGDIDGTELNAINLAGIRMEAAMRVIGAEMMLIAVAITLIVMVTLVYLRSIFISFIVNLGVVVSFGIAFFFYRIVFGIVLFPFLNMMAAFLLIGIACDNVYVLFDSWYTEKAKVIMEDLPDQLEACGNDDQAVLDKARPLPTIFIKKKFYKSKNFDCSDMPELYRELTEKGIDINKYALNMSYVREAPLSNEQMIRAMSGTLHHAASSIFVTSFTTAAAFMTNLITKLPVVQLFGFFTGSCIIVYFILVITVISAFVVTYEKYLQHFSSKLSCSKRLERLYERSIETMSQINQYVISERLPSMLFKLRALWFLVFLAVGCWGMYAVFVDPKLRPNSKWRYEFFQKGNKFENFEFGLRDQFLAYVNHEQRNMTNPEIFFVFGISNEDTGRVFDPDDDGHLVFDANFNFLSEHSQLWVHQFITKRLNENKHLFLSEDIVSEWQAYLFQMQFFCQKILAVNLFSGRVELPFESDKLHRCQEKIKKLLEDSDLASFENLMAAFPRRIIFVSNEKGVAGLILRVNANSSFFDFDSVDAYYHQLVDFQNKYIKPAPLGLSTGWFISVGFALYDLQNQLITGTYSSLVASMIIALVFLLLTSGNIFIAFYAITSISFSIAVTIAIFVSLGWELSILESVVIIMSVGLSVDFACHYGVAYINSDRNFPTVKEKSWWKRYVKANAERKLRIKDVFRRVGSAVLMAALTTFLAGTSMYPSKLTSFSKMGQFLMLVMCTSYLYATFMFVPLCAMFGPTHNFGNLNFRDWGMKIAKACYKKAHHKHKQADVAEEQRLDDNVVSFSLVRAKSGE